MRRISVSGNPFKTPPILVKEYVGLNLGEADHEDVECCGKTAPLHTRADLIQNRRSSVTIPLLSPARRQSLSAGSAGSSKTDGLTSTPDNSPRDDRPETGTKFILNVIRESDNLIETLSAKRLAKRKSKNQTKGKLPSLKPKKPPNGRRKVMGDKGSSIGGNVVDNTGKVEENANKTTQNPPGEGKDGDDFSKYGLDLKRHIGWEISRPFTYSYFPKLQQEKKNPPKRKAKPKTKMLLLTTDVSASDG